MLTEILNSMETDAGIRFNSGRVIHGVILDYFETASPVQNFRFVPNAGLQKFRTTEDPKLVMQLNAEEVTSIDVYLK